MQLAALCIYFVDALSWSERCCCCCCWCKVVHYLERHSSSLHIFTSIPSYYNSRPQWNSILLSLNRSHRSKQKQRRSKFLFTIFFPLHEDCNERHLKAISFKMQTKKIINQSHYVSLNSTKTQEDMMGITVCSTICPRSVTQLSKHRALSLLRSNI